MAGPILRLKDLIAHTGLSRSAIYDRMDKKSPRYAADFPKSFSLSGNAIGWFKSDIDAWLEHCANSSNRGTPSRKTKASPNPPALAARKLSPLDRKSSQPSPTTSKHATAQAQPRRSSRSGNLAEAIVEGGKINDRLLAFLQMKTWTPAMAALLISGIEPPLNCNEIPDGGIGLDEEPLHGSNNRFNEARRILDEWRNWMAEQEDRPPDIEPIRFFNWCMEEDINTEWLRLFLELIGFTDECVGNLTAARFAMLMNR